jgi:hydroxyacylglutathione hydrolase
VTVKRKIAAVVLAALTALAVAGLLLVRASARRHGPPQPVAGEPASWRLRNAFVDLYAVKVDDGVLLFDTGTDAGGGAVDALLAAAGGNRGNVRGVFLTHGHFDHIAAVPLLAGAPIYAGAGDAALLQGRGGKSPIATRLASWIFQVPALAVPAVLQRRIELPVSAGREDVLAIPFPGHTAGSFVYFFRGVLFAGDAIDLKDGALALPAPGFCEDPSAARRSIADLPRLLAGLEVQTICTGHGGCTAPERTEKILLDLIRQSNLK